MSLERIRGPVITPNYEKSEEKKRHNDKGMFEPDDVSIDSSNKSKHKSDMKFSEEVYGTLTDPAAAKISRSKGSAFSS